MANRAQRRKAEKELHRLALDHQCSRCKRPFAHNDRTYGGIAYDGAPAFTSDCCVWQLCKLMALGFYVSPGEVRDGLLKAMTENAGKRQRRSPEEIDEVIGKFHDAVSEFEKFKADASRGSGIDAVRLRTDMPLPAEWKADDAAWFKAHPNRAHRVRDRFPGEQLEHGTPGHAIEKVLIRQVQEGRRIRTRFSIGVAGSDATFLDLIAELFERGEHEEAVAHMLFDLSQKEAGPIYGRDVMEMLNRYETAGGLQA